VGTTLSDLAGIYITCVRKLDDGGSLQRKIPAQACVMHATKKTESAFVRAHHTTLYPFCSRCEAWKEQLRAALSRREGKKIKQAVQTKQARRKKL
jgi:hypothetical protein